MTVGPLHRKTERTGQAVESRGIFTPELLDACISCGFCLPACPTYKRTGAEPSSPRGRISLMRALEVGGLSDDDPTVLEESSFCVGCRACEPVCPAGVQYGDLLEEWREHMWTPRRRSWKLKALMRAVAKPGRVRALGLARRHARRRRRDAPAHLMLGCFERALYPRVSRAALELEPELDCPPDQGCCGALHAHNGELERGREMCRELGARLPGTIVTTAGGCAAHMVAVLGRERVRELSEWLAERGREFAPRDGRPRVALQDSCHARNGLRIAEEPRALIEQVAELVELPSADECCGSAGSYSILRPDDSRRMLDDKLREIEAADVDVVVTINPGCYRQLEQGVRRARLRTRVVHLAELLADAQGDR
ncbi:MAG: (Fe-S)-binding protein [Nocardioidaceae bacterium]